MRDHFGTHLGASSTLFWDPWEVKIDAPVAATDEDEEGEEDEDEDEDMPPKWTHMDLTGAPPPGSTPTTPNRDETTGRLLNPLHGFAVGAVPS